MGALILTMTSCQSLVWSQTVPQASAQAPITIETIQAIGSSGEYTIQGLAQVADNTQIAISAVQTPKGSQYQILDRKRAYVRNRQWQVSLNVANVSPQTQAASTGEGSTSLSGGSNDVDITILATLDPALQSQALTRKLSRQTQNYESGYIRINDEGELYAVASKTLKVSTKAMPPPSINHSQPTSAVPKVVQPTQVQGIQATGDRQKKASTQPLAPSAFFN
jgi:hypothetical protein